MTSQLPLRSVQGTAFETAASLLLAGHQPIRGKSLFKAVFYDLEPKEFLPTKKSARVALDRSNTEIASWPILVYLTTLFQLPMLCKAEWYGD
jgi:hypothetical protein